MDSFSVLTNALNYIEANLCSDIEPEDIARHCSYSLSSLQKMFRRIFRIGIADYITRRKITSASRELLDTDSSVLDIAVKYGYNSNEVFSRAFVRIWGETPSRYRRNRSFSEIYPKLDMPVEKFVNSGGDIVENKKKFDITELYDFMKRMDGTLILSFDIKNLMPINDNYGSAAGDLAIAECLKRIDNEKSDDMIMFRIGGDEFVLFTCTDKLEEANAVGGKILAHNGETVSCGGNEIPVSMRYGVMTLESRRNLRYGELFTELVNIARPENTDN